MDYMHIEYLPELERKIDNNRPITIQIDGGAISEKILFTPMFRVNKNITVEYLKNNEQSKNLVGIFKNLTNKIVGVDSFDRKTKVYPKRYDSELFSICNSDMFGLDIKNHIPFIILNEEEIDWALKYISKFDKPVIVFSPIAGGFKNKCQTAMSKMMRIENWEKILSIISKKYSILFITKPDNDLNIKNTIKCFDLSDNIRKFCSISRVCGKYIGIDSGLSNLALASGAFIHDFIPTFGYKDGTNFSNWVYKPEHFIDENCRIRYYLFENYEQILNDL